MWQPVAVEVKPVVVGATVGDGLRVLTIVCIEARVYPPVRVAPVGKSIEAVRVEHWVENDDDVLELFE